MSHETRTFPLGHVLSITTGRLVSETDPPIGGVYDILNWMTNDNLYTHQLPRAMGECQPWLCRFFPELPSRQNGGDKFDGENGRWRQWLAEQIATHGASRDVPRIAPDDHARRDPVSELFQLVDDPTKIIVVERERDA